MESCLFCKIIDREIPSEMVYEDDLVYAFNDIDKKAPVHILIIPKKHLGSVMEVGEDAALLNAMFNAANNIAQQQSLDKNGFRLVINTGKDGGQTVGHLHMHLLGGRGMEWPPG